MIIHAAWDGTQPLPEAFVALPAQVYAGDPFWPGEDSDALRRDFAATNHWFAGGRAWLGVAPGTARLAGFFRPGQLVDGEPAAFFGYWECTADSAAANDALFAALAGWAREQGARRLYGPINFTTYGNYRLRLDAFDDGAFPGEPWNPPHYAAQLARLGFDIRYRYFSTFNDTAAIVDAVKNDYLRVKPKLETAVRLEAMTPEFWLANLDELYGFVDQVFGGNFAYTPIDRATFAAQCGTPFADRFCPRTSVLARAHDGRIAGFFLVYPDYGPLLRQGNPQRVAAADLRYATHAGLLPRPRRALAKTGGVHPDFRALGLFTAMGCELTLRAEGLYEQIAGTLVREDNRSLNFAARHGTAAQHAYALYVRAP
ncbi:MAG: hypothetical protein ACOY33_07480 [Pseudomonadota bacterium]